MGKKIYSASLLGVSILSGCASIDFGGDGLTYYDPKPYLFVSKTDKCVSSATVINIPGQKKTMKFGSGYGSSDLSATFSNNMVTGVGQKNDSKVPETITSIAALATATLTGASVCKPTATLYPLINGVPETNSPINLLVE
jgi:hypothetical protein